MWWAAPLFLLLAQPADSPIKADEVVVFVPTYARLDPDGKTWRLPVHGWIFEPETDSLTRRAALGVFRRALGLEAGAEDTALFKERAGLFLVDNQRGKKVPVRLGPSVEVMGESEANGHFRGTLTLSADEAARLLKLQVGKHGWLTFQAVTRPQDERLFRGQVQLLPATGWSVISDIDDTIKISEVRDKQGLLANTFLREFRPAPGMAALYQDWQTQGAAFHYVSGSPWQLVEPVRAFADKAGFPLGSYHMKDFRWKDSSVLNLLGAQQEFKLGAIEPILTQFPQRRFVLVGDSGEQDPEIYGTLARKYPKQIARIFIRNVTAEPAAAERYRKSFADVPAERWHIFQETKEIGAALRLLKD